MPGVKVAPGSALVAKGQTDESSLASIESDVSSDFSETESEDEGEDAMRKRAAEQDASEASINSKAKRMVVGQAEEVKTGKMLRDEARQREIALVLGSYTEKPKAKEEPPKKERKNRPLYQLRKALDCCVHVPLQDAVLEANTGQVRSFLVRWSKRKEGKERINEVDAKGRGVLSLALKEGREDIADFLVSLGETDPDLPDHDTKLRPLHHAVLAGQVNSIQKLMMRNAEINCKDITGMTPLMLACKLGNEPMVEKLIEMGAGCEKRDKAGWTPLHYASYSGDIDTIDTLLDQGVPHRKKDKFGLCPVDWAHYMGHGEAEAFLEDYRPTMDLDRYQHW